MLFSFSLLPCFLLKLTPLHFNAFSPFLNALSSSCHHLVIKFPYSFRFKTRFEVTVTNPANALMHGDPRRRFKDKLARFFVSVGGLLVISTLVLIFFYLICVVFPLFKSPHIEISQQFKIPSSDHPVQIGSDEQNQFLFRYSDNGTLRVFSVKEKGKIVFQKNLVQKPSSFFSLPSSPMHSAFGLQDGTVHFHTLRFPSSISNQTENSSPSRLPELRQDPPLLLADNETISQLSFSMQENQRLVAGIAGKNLILVWQENQREIARTQLEGFKNAKILLSQNGKTLFALFDERLSLYHLSLGVAEHIQTVEFKMKNGIKSSGMGFFAGGHSLFIRFTDGHLEKWFNVIENNKKRFIMAQKWPIKNGLFATEPYRHVFATFSQKDDLLLWHTRNKKPTSFKFPLLSKNLKAMSFSVHGEYLYVEQAGQLTQLHVNNPYPEVSLYSLWDKIWYEGYEAPSYIWQSSPSREINEGKVSLTPLLFGSIKIAAYSLFFSIPLALGGAIYTAYFMPASFRKVVKPTIEIMEALPTVILGFLAALWLSPIIEKHLIATGLIFLFLPLLFVFAGLIWSNLPKAWRAKLPQNLHFYVLLPLIFLFGYGACWVAPFIEIHLLGQDARTFVTEVLGVNFEQRNTLIVGLAMSFAVIPTIFTIAEDAIFSVPRHLTNGSLALGATYWQTLTGVVLLTASPGIFAAIMMGLGRAIGETMIVLMATGNTPIMDWNLFEGARTLSANIAIEMPKYDVSNTQYRVLFLSAFILFSFTFLLHTLAEFARQRLREKYRAL